MSWLLDLRHCNSTVAGADDVASAALCSLSLPQMYTLMVLTARHANVEKAIYRVRLKLRGALFFSSAGAGGGGEKRKSSEIPSPAVGALGRHASHGGSPVAGGRCSEQHDANLHARHRSAASLPAVRRRTQSGVRRGIQ